MKPVVDCGLCIACGLCEETCPDVFRVEDDCARVIDESPAAELYGEVQEAAEICPTEAITVLASEPV